MKVTPWETARRKAANVFSGAYPDAPRWAMASTASEPSD